MDLAKESNYGYDLDVGQLFHDWEHNKHREFLTYRDQVTSKIPKIRGDSKSVIVGVPLVVCHNLGEYQESMQSFVLSCDSIKVVPQLLLAVRSGTQTEKGLETSHLRRMFYLLKVWKLLILNARNAHYNILGRWTPNAYVCFCSATPASSPV